MRIRIAALVILTLTTSCGDPTTPEDDLATATGVITVSGALTSVDTMMANEANLGGNHLVFTPRFAADSFRIHGVVDLDVPLPYIVTIDFLNVIQLKEGTYPVAATSVVLLDSLGLKSMEPILGDSASGFPITYPTSDQLAADTGHVTFDLVTGDRVAGTLVYHLTSDAGRTADITGRFNAVVHTFASPRLVPATSP